MHLAEVQFSACATKPLQATRSTRRLTCSQASEPALAEVMQNAIFQAITCSVISKAGAGL